jgi:HJR/Mrr/RecB family endonuclease
VFVSHASTDKAVAREVADALRTAGVKVWLDSWEFEQGDSIADLLNKSLAACDILLVLLSPASVRSRWVQSELASALEGELHSRSITVVGALVKNCEIPVALSNRLYFDLTERKKHALETLIDHLKPAQNIDFNKLTPRDFEGLVTDLLTELHFKVSSDDASRDCGFDLMASHTSSDPFNVGRRETWLVETKLYREERVSVSVLRTLLGALLLTGADKKGLLVTNCKLTSVAREFLDESTCKSAATLRVIDGPELVSLLIKHPRVARAYFSAEGGHE